MCKVNTAHVFSWKQTVGHRTAESHHVKPKVIKDPIVVRAYTQAAGPCVSVRTRLKSGAPKTMASRPQPW